uniref:SirA family protein n=1 Tax=uncultured bacterium UPO47 TaxID=1776972 RepID=A0A126SY70_9BACT|nr:SirA family protein [uncultured bacterium UPO47]
MNAVVEPAIPLVDLSTYGCPLHYVKARQALSRLAAGERMVFLFTAGESAAQVRDSLAADGHRVLSVEPMGNTLRVEVVKVE